MITTLGRPSFHPTPVRTQASPVPLQGEQPPSGDSIDLSPAAQQALEPSDVMTQIDAQPAVVLSPDQLGEARAGGSDAPSTSQKAVATEMRAVSELADRPVPFAHLDNKNQRHAFAVRHDDGSLWCYTGHVSEGIGRTGSMTVDNATRYDVDAKGHVKATTFYPNPQVGDEYWYFRLTADENGLHASDPNFDTACRNPRLPQAVRQ